MNNKRTVIALVFMLLVVGCTTSTPQPAPTLAPTAVLPTATLAPTVTQVPTATLTPAPPEPTIDFGNFPIGKYSVKGSTSTWTFTAEGKYNHQGTTPGTTHVYFEKGTFTVSGNKITLMISSTSDPCGAEIYTYTWETDGNVLTFKSVDDTCETRVYGMEHDPWVKQP